MRSLRVSAVIADACFLITFGNAGALGVVTSLQAHRILVSARSLGEVTKAPAHTALHAALAAGTIAVESIDLEDAAEQGALARFDARIAFRNRGDAEVLALAVSRGYIVASDDRAVRSAAIAEVGATRLAGTVDFLKWAVSEGRLEKAQALTLLGTLDVGAGIIVQVAARGQVLDDLF
jgi:predicted nucleic acid-binding protein